MIPQDETVQKHLKDRSRVGTIWKLAFYLSTAVAITFLILLILNIVNGAFGFVAIENTIEPEKLAIDGRQIEDLKEDELIGILKDNLSTGLIRRFNHEEALDERSKFELVSLVYERVVAPTIVKSWSLTDSIFQKDEIFSWQREKYPDSVLEFRSWLNPRFIRSPQSPVPEFAGIRTALFGSIWMIVITLIFAFPIGVAAAIYLEEYADDSWITRIIQVNIYNLSGVPSIIYGLLGLAVFVRLLEPVTSGAIFEATVDGATASGRTILSAGLTLGLLILPIIIINSQEAIRAVPQSLRDSSYGLGATKWQTILHHVLPSSFDRILTGTILSVSRAVGETAPLVVVGASTFISVDPSNVFSKFTTLPIQIYQWTARPQAEFRNIAAAAIIALLILLLSMNAFAIIARDKIRKKRKG
jgi:phosphate transport system permease protein